MSRWQKLVDNLLTDLETETPGAADLRVNVDHKIWEVEQKASKEGPYETKVRRLHGFQCELIEKLSKQLKNDPANEILLEARSLLENAWLRIPGHQRPDLKMTAMLISNDRRRGAADCGEHIAKLPELLRKP